MAVVLLIDKYITGPPLDLTLADGLRSGDNGGRLMLVGIGWGIFMARIAVGGFQHETNTFLPVEAPFSEFERHDGWPGLGAEVSGVDQLCRFNRRPDSIAFRDNRCAQHMALWNYHPETRSGHRFTVA